MLPLQECRLDQGHGASCAVRKWGRETDRSVRGSERGPRRCGLWRGRARALVLGETGSPARHAGMEWKSATHVTGLQSSIEPEPTIGYDSVANTFLFW